MYYEMRTYSIKVGKMKEYLKHFEEVGLPIISKYAKLVGWWYTEIGELNQVVHIWGYESLDERISKREDLYNDEDWLGLFVPKAFSMLERQESKLLRAADFSPIR
jgi:hypothetical protein